jgi:hypothetical protein
MRGAFVADVASDRSHRRKQAGEREEIDSLAGRPLLALGRLV